MSWLYWLSRTLLWLVAAPLLWFRREGHRLFPRTGPVLILANHASYLDPAVVGMSCPRQVHFVMRTSLQRGGITGWWLRNVQAIGIDRDAPTRAAIDVVVSALAAGRVVCIFPEGTRSRDGRVGPFKRGALVMLKRTGAQVVPAGVAGTWHAWPRGRKLPRPARCRVRLGAPLSAAEVLAEGGFERVRAAIAELAGQELAPAEDSGSETQSPDSRISSDLAASAEAARSASTPPDGPAATPPAGSVEGSRT